MAKVQNYLGIDYGTVRVGLAAGDSETKVAWPQQTISNDPKLIDTLQDIIKEQSIDVLVIGLPRGLDGQDTDQTRLVREVVEKDFVSLNVPHVFQDEAGTSSEAEARLRDRGDKLFNKEDIDMEAAAIILQDYLDNAA
jgi:putative Holliday junction resolvase